MTTYNTDNDDIIGYEHVPEHVVEPITRNTARGQVVFVPLEADGETDEYSLAELVLSTHHMERPSDEDWIAWHINRDITDNAVTNLRWVLFSETVVIDTDMGYKILELKPDALLW